MGSRSDDLGAELRMHSLTVDCDTCISCPDNKCRGCGNRF